MPNTKLINDLQDVEQYLPHKMSTIYDIQTCIGACVLSEKSGPLPLETALLADIGIMENHLGNTNQLMTIDFEYKNDELTFDSITVHDYTQQLAEQHPLSTGYNYGTGPTVTHYANGKEPNDILHYTGDSEKKTYTPMTAVYNWPDKAKSAEHFTDNEYPQWLIDLDNLSENQIRDIETEYQSRAPEDEYDGFISITIDGQPPTELDQYIEIYQSIKREDKKESNGYTSIGQAPGLVTNTTTQVIGVDDSPPWDYHTTKTRENHPQFNPEQNWRHRPIGYKTALIMDAGKDTIENEFTYRLDNSDIKYYAIPYPEQTTLTPEKIAKWYTTLKTKIIDNTDLEEYKPDKLKQAMSLVSDKNVSSVEALGINNENNEQNLCNAVYISIQNTDGQVDRETSSMNVTHDTLEQLRETLKEILQKQSNDIGFTNGIQDPELEEFDIIAATLLNPNWHANNTCYRTGPSKRNRDAQSIEFQLVQTLLSESGKISYPELLTAFTERLTTQLHNNLDLTTPAEQTSFDNKYGFIETASNQDIILGLLSQTNKLSNKHDTQTNIQVEELSPVTQEHLENRPYMAYTTAIFPYIIGTVIGTVSQLQADRGTTPLYNQYPIESVTDTSIKQLLTDTTNTLYTYSAQDQSKLSVDNHKYTVLPHTLTDLNTILSTAPEPTTWNLSNPELQYYYAIGIATTA